MSDEPLTPSASSEAGDVGEDEERQKTEEERLLEEIAKQKELVDATPRDTREEIKHRASHQKKLGQLEFKYHLLVEKKRLTGELLRFQELYGDIHSDIHLHASEDLMVSFPCCGGFVCKSCTQDIHESGVDLNKCPLCREWLNDKTAAEDAAQVMVLAKRGVVWAQSYVGRCMISGRRGFEKQEKTGIELLNRAAAQGHPPALYQLSYLHREESKCLVKSPEKADELLLKSANLGYARANSALAQLYLSGAYGFEEDKDEAYFRASVALALDGGDGAATMVLGTLHFFEHLPKPSFYLACYYSNIAASEDTTGVASQIYSRSLLQLAVYLHGDNSPNGYNAMPAAHIWLRKSCEMVSEDTRMLLKTGLKNVDHHFQSSCGNCSRMAEAGEKYKQCSKCKAQWYCSKECQVEAWRAGHKQDCKRATILKFEDYINAE